MGKNFIFYIALFLLICSIAMSVSYMDFDLWARLIAGMGVVDGGHVLTQDFLSYTPVHTWWDHEWGAGVIFYSVMKIFGPYSLIIMQAVMYFLILFTASKVIKLRGCKNPYNILFYFFAFMAMSHNIDGPIRCHMFSFLLFTVFIYLLEIVRRGNNKPLYFIPFIVLVWNNIHGGVVSGLGLLAMYALGEYLNGKSFAKYIYSLLASLAVLLINPWGIEYVKFLLMANTMKRPDIVEWWSIFHQYHMFKHIKFKLFMFAILIIEFVYPIKKLKSNWYKNADKVKYIVLLSTLYLAISHVKLMPFFVIASLCFVYEDFYSLIQDVKFPKWKDKAVYLFIILLSLFSFTVKDFSLPLGMNYYPVKEVEFIRKNNIEGKILTNFNVGSYVSYKLYPHNLIFMDGRYEEVYYDYMVPLLKQFFLVNSEWDTVLKYFPPDVMILEKNYPVYEVIKNSKEWTLVYEGDIFGVFLPQAKANRNFVKPSDDLDYYKNTLFTTDINFKS